MFFQEDKKKTEGNNVSQLFSGFFYFSDFLYFFLVANALL